MTMICPDCGNMIAYNSYFSAFYCPRCGGIFKKVKPMTNADRIRSMNDAQLASMLKDYKDCSKNCIISNGKHCYQICEEESVLLKWLQQPAEER